MSTSIRLLEYIFELSDIDILYVDMDAPDEPEGIPRGRCNIIMDMGAVAVALFDGESSSAPLFFSSAPPVNKQAPSDLLPILPIGPEISWWFGGVIPPHIWRMTAESGAKSDSASNNEPYYQSSFECRLLTVLTKQRPRPMLCLTGKRSAPAKRLCNNFLTQSGPSGNQQTSTSRGTRLKALKATTEDSRANRIEFWSASEKFDLLRQLVNSLPERDEPCPS
ncbi:hypothetical protein C8R43DRAFT_964857 [Mycena crocata]|nr:hypothetical protein C8R43DRAFT_964857 [Mycena crocata]